MTSATYPNRLLGRNIRVLELLPGDKEEQIQCRLVETSLDGVISYEALSYVWGNSSSRERICCNGQDMEVTVSLAQALRRLRPSRVVPDVAMQVDSQAMAEDTQNSNAELTASSVCLSRMIWADAICINQEDVIERNSQVQLMREVYSKATRVVVWLGPDVEGHAKAAVAAIELVAHFISTYQKFANDMREKGIEWNNQGRGHFTFKLVEDLMQSKDIVDPWPSIRALFLLPYWSRIWCVQEVHLGQEVAFLFGSETLDGKSLAKFTDWYMRESHRYNLENSGQKAKEQISLDASAIRHAWTQLNHNNLNAKDLFLVCDDFRLLQATNPRDKVYGALGMWRPKPGEYSTIEVDYNKSVAEVYTDVATQAICDRKDLFVLRFVHHGTDHNFEEAEGFPSWVPRWDQGSQWGVSWLDKSPLSASMYQAEIPDLSLARSGVLKLKGVLFDRVVYTSNVLDQGSKSFMTDAEFRNGFIQLWLEAIGAKPNAKFPHQVSVAELATTVTSGMIKTSSDIHDKDTRDPDSWLDMSSLDTDAGREFLYSFKSFMDSDTYPGHPRGFDKLLDCQGKRLFRTSRGHLGLGRRSMREGDFVAVLHGGRVPFILRTMGKPGAAYFVFVGDCFVHDIMNREVYNMLEEHGVATGMFELR